MNDNQTNSWIAFSNNIRIAFGSPQEVVTDIKRQMNSYAADNLIVLDAITSETIEIDFRGSLANILKRLPSCTTPCTEKDLDQPSTFERTVGRPKLGVTPREVTLLPRHWEWLATQPGGASATLRKLVEQALRSSKDADRVRRAQESTYRFMSVIAGDRPGYEEATRALFANDSDRLQQHISKWPRDIRCHALNLASAAIAK